jgi:serine/threonine protein kinase
MSNNERVTQNIEAVDVKLTDKAPEIVQRIKEADYIGAISLLRALPKEPSSPEVGCFGRVFLADGVAYKVSYSHDASKHRQLISEAAYLQQLQGSNVIEYIQHFEACDLGTMWLFLEMKRADTTLAHIIDNKELTMEMSKNVLLGVLNGLARIHEKGLVHCDIKPNNIGIMLPFKGPDDVKLLDFGGVVSVNERPHTFSRDYAATDFFRVGALPQTDIFAVGILLQECLENALSSTKGYYQAFGMQRVILKACSFDADQRYISAKTMQAEISHEFSTIHPHTRFEPIDIVTFGMQETILAEMREEEERESAKCCIM